MTAGIWRSSPIRGPATCETENGGGAVGNGVGSRFPIRAQWAGPRRHFGLTRRNVASLAWHFVSPFSPKYPSPFPQLQLMCMLHHAHVVSFSKIHYRGEVD